MTERIVAQGSIPEFKNDGDELDKYYLPVRGLGLKGDHHILPDEKNVREYQEYLNKILISLSLSPRNPFYVPDSDYLLDLSILNYLSTNEGIEQFKNRYPSNCDYVVWPYTVTEETIEWTKLLRSNGYNIEPAFNQKPYQLNHPAHRGGWGKWVSNPENPSFPESAKIPYPTSWLGQGLKEVLEAYNKVVEETGESKAVLKPIFSAGGFTLGVVNSTTEVIEYYQNLSEKELLTNPDIWEGEMPIEVQQYVDIKKLYSLQYIHGEIITPGGVSIQLIEGNNWIGNGFNFNIDNEVIKSVNEIWNNFRQKYPNIQTSWGGLDLALTPQGLIVLEHNGERITGAIPIISIAQQLKLESIPFAAKKSPGNPNCDLKTLWEFLETKKLAFDKKNSGIFPIIWFPGSGMLMAFGKTPEETLQMLDQVYNELINEGYIL